MDRITTTIANVVHTTVPNKNERENEKNTHTQTAGTDVQRQRRRRRDRRKEPIALQRRCDRIYLHLYLVPNGYGTRLFPLPFPFRI